MPDPAVRSTTVRETSTSPAPAAEATRAAEAGAAVNGVGMEFDNLIVPLT